MTLDKFWSWSLTYRCIIYKFALIVKWMLSNCKKWDKFMGLALMQVLLYFLFHILQLQEIVGVACALHKFRSIGLIKDTITPSIMPLSHPWLTCGNLSTPRSSIHNPLNNRDYILLREHPIIPLIILQSFNVLTILITLIKTYKPFQPVFSLAKLCPILTCHCIYPTTWKTLYLYFF